MVLNPDYVDATVTGEISQEPRVLFDPPRPGVVGEVVADSLHASTIERLGPRDFIGL